MAAKFSMASTGMFGAEDHAEASIRMENAMKELRQRQDYEDAVKQQQEAKETKTAQAKETKSYLQSAVKNETYEERAKDPTDHNNQDEDEDEDNFEQDDEEFLRLRAARLAQLKLQQEQKLVHLAKGHGHYSEVFQDDFLNKTIASDRVVVHFYHSDFEKCKILDHHLAKIAPHHLECKFMKLNAEKAPFFISKLQVRVLPTIVCFVGGVALEERIVGYQGLCDDVEEGKEDEFPTSALARKFVELEMIYPGDSMCDEDQASRDDE